MLVHVTVSPTLALTGFGENASVDLLDEPGVIVTATLLPPPDVPAVELAPAVALPVDPVMLPDVVALDVEGAGGDVVGAAIAAI